MSDLVAFLRARLDEDEAAALLASSGPWHATVDALGIHVEGNDGRGRVVLRCGDDRVDGKDLENAEHIARWDPARVLAEVAAKRAILKLYDLAGYYAYHQGDDWYAGAEDRRLGLQRAVEELAQPYADHPDFDPALG